MRILIKRNRKGYFGIKTQYEFFGFPLFSIIRESNHDLIKVFNKGIFRINRKENDALLDNVNKEESNLLLVRDMHTKDKKILYVITDLNNCGGVETRLAQQFSYVKERGWCPMILSMRNDFVKLHGYPNFYLNFKTCNAAELFLELVDKLNPDVIEFQFKPSNFFYDVDISSLMRKCIVGCCIHEEIKVEQSVLDKLDYRIASARRKSVTNATYILNWTKATQFSWKYKKQRKAILVSRLSQDKLPGIINFIKICNQYKVDYHIAGAFDGANKIVSKLIKEGLNENVFIGYIDTIPFLEEHADEYLFVAGVGQAIMEAASLGYPALVTAFTKNYHHSSFITPDNIKYLRSDNFVIRDPPCFQSNVSAFFENVCSGIVSQQFNVAQNMYELCDINSVLPEYLAILKEASIKRKSVTGEVI
ncbi:hypothetical protein CSU32_02575 [Salmonella enterica subsp. diarizonae]|nr:hypothetical protein [Salmonella enterica subsp. diarizonae]ECI3359719.1 hypothetical protein [Salmonella enterica subsp. diarizonae]